MSTRQQTHIIRLVQVRQVQILNELLHNAHVVALSPKVEGIHSILKRARVGETITLQSSPPALRGEGFCPGVIHIPTWFLALWSAPALTSMSMISRLPDQDARWITVKPCFLQKRNLSLGWATTLSQPTKARLIPNCWKLRNDSLIYSKGDVWILRGQWIYLTSGIGTSSSSSGKR